MGNGAQMVVHENDLLHLFFCGQMDVDMKHERETWMENRRARRTTVHTFFR